MTATQTKAIVRLKQHIDGAAVTGEERLALQTAMKAIEKEASSLRFQLERTLRKSAPSPRCWPERPKSSKDPTT